MTHKSNWVRFAIVVFLSLPLAACKDTKTLQENEQLKVHLAELQKENGQMGNDLEAMTAARDELTKENGALKAQLNSLKKKHSSSKSSKKHHHK